MGRVSGLFSTHVHPIQRWLYNKNSLFNNNLISVRQHCALVVCALLLRHGPRSPVTRHQTCVFVGAGTGGVLLLILSCAIFLADFSPKHKTTESFCSHHIVSEK